MGKLCDKIRHAVEREQVIIGDHADERMLERKIELWQVVSEIGSAILIAERPGDKPNPTVEMEQRLADGTPIRVVWAWIAKLRIAKLVTVYFIE